MRRSNGEEPAILPGMAIDPKLMEILVCPLSHAPLKEVDGWLVSTDPGTRRRYPIRDGIPVMLIEEAEEMSAEDWKRALGDG